MLDFILFAPDIKLFSSFTEKKRKKKLIHKKKISLSLSIAKLRLIIGWKHNRDLITLIIVTLHIIVKALLSIETYRRIQSSHHRALYDETSDVISTM